MSTMTIGKKLVELCKKGKNIEAIDTLYSKEIVSIEPMAMNGPTETKGIEAVREKNKLFIKNHEIHSSEILGPFSHGDRIAVFSKFDVTSKEREERFDMEEIAVYTIKNDKIVKEEFFYCNE